MATRCGWCRSNPDSDLDVARACVTHAAEFLGCTVAEVEAIDAGTETLDSLGLDERGVL